MPGHKIIKIVLTTITTRISQRAYVLSGDAAKLI